MNLFLNYDFERTFPFVVLDYYTESTTANLHMHDYLEIVLCVEGSGQFLFPHKTLDICQGDVLFIDRFYNHVAVTFDPQRPVKLLLILFLPALVDSVWLTHRDKAALEQFWNNKGENVVKISPEADCLPSMTKMIKDIASVWEKKAGAYQMEIDGTLKLLLAQALRYYWLVNPNQPLIDYSIRAKFQVVLTYIQEHSAEKITIQQLSLMVHQSESQFRHNFKLATKMSFKQYLGYVRITKAIHLLISTDSAITDIATQIGFSNMNQFYRLFRTYTAMSPAQFRKRNKGMFLPEH